MTKQENINQFNRDVDNLLKGNPNVKGATDAERFQAARQLAAVDFSARRSAHSHARETTRNRILARANRELPVQKKRNEMNTRFSNLFRTLAFGAMLLMIVFGLGWVLSNTAPKLGVGIELSPTSEPVYVTEEFVLSFPRQRPGEDQMEALLTGHLVLVDTCLRIEDPLSNTSLLPIWPHDFDWQIKDRLIEVLDGNGQVVARVGQDVSMGGGELEGMGLQYETSGPGSCDGPYWIVGQGTHIVPLEPFIIRSEANHLEVTVPAGWAAYEGEEYLVRPFTGVMAFNSWGEQGFWVKETATVGDTSNSYSPLSVLTQIPQDGAYIVLVWQSGGPPAEEGLLSEYTDDDLSGLWQPGDCRQKGSQYFNFYKFDRPLRLEIYCGARTSDATVSDVDFLLSSWRFDTTQLSENPSLMPTHEASTPLTMDSDSETIRKRILYSYEHWQTMWVDGQINDYNGVDSSQRVQVWLNQPAQARVLTGPVNGVPNELWISDGQMTRTGEDLSGYGLDGSFMAPVIESKVIYPHPMSSILPTPLSSLLFPSGLAQRGGTYRPISIETLGGRETLVVEWNRPDGPLVDRFWVDTMTGIILRQQNYGKGGDGALTTEYLITDIQYDLTFPSETFNTLAAFPPEFSVAPDDVYTGIATPVPEGEPDTSMASGEIYMLLETNNASETAGFVHFPASCLITGQVCPSPTFVPEQPKGFGYPGISWSPDGNKMVYLTTIDEDQIWIFDRPDQTWSLLNAPYIGGVSWSPDGRWLAGQPVVRGNQISNPIVLVSSDGLEWMNIMEKVPGFKSPVGWIDNERILLVNTLDNETSETDSFVYSEIQVYNIQTQEITILGQHQWDIKYYGLSIPVITPDRSRIAYSLNDSNGNQGIVIELSSGSLSQFSLLSGSRITSWSPDGNHLVLTASVDNACEFHLIPVDGSDDDLLFTSDSGTGCNYIWNPDGEYLLVPALAQNPSIPRLYFINVATGESRLVELPDVGVSFEWPVLFWVP